MAAITLAAMALTTAAQAKSPCAMQYALASTEAASVGVIVACRPDSADLASEDVLLSSDVAKSLGLRAGDRLNLLSPQGPDTPLGAFPVMKVFTVAPAAFNHPIEPNTVIISRDAFRALFDKNRRGNKKAPVEPGLLAS